MTSKNLIQTIKVLIYAAVIGTPLFYFRYGVYPYTLGKTPFFQGIVEIAFFLWLALLLKEKKYRPAATPVFWGILAFLAALTLTAFLGVDPWRSFWSIQERAFGVVTFMHLGVLAIIISSLFHEVSWKKLLYASLGTSAVTAVIAFLQLVIPNLLLIESVGNRPGATFGNPTFLAGYLLVNIGVGIYLLCDLYRKDLIPDAHLLFKTIFVSTASIISAAALFQTQTRGDILGFLAMFFALAFLFAFRPPAVRIRAFTGRRFYASLCIGSLLLGGIFWFTRFSAIWEQIPGINRFKDVSLEAESLQPRLAALKAAWIGFTERPLQGWGWDNFDTVFNKHYDPRTLELGYEETRFDKPHNVFLEYLVSGGLLLMLLYAALIAVFVFELRRTTDRLWSQTMYAVLAGYLVRSAFIFETIGPALAFFMIIGIADGRYRDEREARGKETQPAAAFTNGKNSNSLFRASAASSWAAGSALAFGIIVAYLLNIQTLRAANYQYEGFTNSVARRPWSAIQNFEAGIALSTPYRWNFKIDYAASIAEAYFYNPGLVNPDDVLKAIRGMEEVATEHPQDAYNHYVLVDMYNQVSAIDPEGLTAKAEHEAAMALALSPNRQEVYFSLAKTKTIEGEYPAALEIMKHAIALDDKVPDAHFYYGLIAFAAKDPGTGYVEIKRAMALGRRWRNANEPRVSANYFADNGHLPEAIDLYQAAIALDPNDEESKIKLGIGYFFLGNRDLARQYLKDVAKNVNLSKSPAYADLAPIFTELGLPL